MGSRANENALMKSANGIKSPASICSVLTMQFDNLIKTPGKSRLLFKNLDFCLNWCVTTMQIMVFYSFAKKMPWCILIEIERNKNPSIGPSYRTTSPYNESIVSNKQLIKTRIKTSLRNDSIENRSIFPS